MTTTFTPSPASAEGVPFVGVADMAALVRGHGIETVLAELAEAIEADFRRWAEFDKTPRLASHSRDGVIELMPTSDGRLYGFKYVNGHPVNGTRGLQTVVAFGCLSDVETGYPLLLAEMTLLTALRTAAMSALVARRLAPSGVTTMALIGNGAQSEFQAMAFRALCGITALRLYDTDPAASRKCAANLEAQGFAVTVCASAEMAVEGAGIITTVTADKRRAHVLGPNMVGAGVHLNAVGGDCPGKTELPPEVLHRASIFVELPEQTREEGEIQQLPHDHPVTLLSEVFLGRHPGRQSASEITLFDSVGFAIEDFSALRYIHGLALRTGRFGRLDLLVQPEDNRDLFSLVR